ncbi:MAG: sigma-70 family RNA polymerase sigma factor [Clostridia bacterium]|nr:sigma-70 family RNA polymerase sigma factor [Clostridia bacterium]
MSEKQNGQFLMAAKAGDEHAFASLVRVYQDRVYSLAYYMTKNHHDAEDVAQEVFLKIWRALPSYRGENEPDAWIMKIAKNACYDFLKSRRQVEPLEREIDGEVVERPLADPDPDSNPPEAAVLSEQRDEVAKALLRLPPEQREILTLRYVDGLSYEQLARVMSLGMGTVKSKLWRAKKALKNILQNGNISE